MKYVIDELMMHTQKENWTQTNSMEIAFAEIQFRRVLKVGQKFSVQKDEQNTTDSVK